MIYGFFILLIFKVAFNLYQNYHTFFRLYIFKVDVLTPQIKMAQSVKIDFNKWSEFDHHSYDIMHEDFIHDRLLRVNANIIDVKGRIRLQETLIKSNQKLTTDGQTNIWFPIKDNKSLYFQIRNKGLRVHFDNGLLAKKHLMYNLYGSYESDRKMQSAMYKIGCETISQNWKLNLRYRYSQADQSNKLYSRWRFDYKNLTFQGIKAVSLNTLNILKNNFLIGYYSGNQTYHLRVGNDDFRDEKYFDFKNSHWSQYFDHIIVNYTRTVNQNQRLGLQTKVDTSTGIWKGVALVWEDYDPQLHRTFKIKINSDMSAALSLRNTMGSYGTYLLGVGVKQMGMGNNDNKIKFGVEVNLNL